MLRYVRTKDTEYGAIIDTKKYKEITGEDCYIPKDEIVAEANTIEELCDEFVFDVKKQGYWIIRTYKRAKEIAQSYKEDETNFICYGAIWCDKGLIYVAKMNDKGELELL